MFGWPEVLFLGLFEELSGYLIPSNFLFIILGTDFDTFEMISMSNSFSSGAQFLFLVHFSIKNRLVSYLRKAGDFF